MRTGQHYPIYGMGRHNHENSVPIPGFDDLVVLSGDDTFTNGTLTGVFPAGAVPSQSQLYSYIADSTDSLLADEGDLWAFVSDTPGVKNYYNVLPNSGTIVTGHFIQVPKNIATGLNPDGSEVKAADFGSRCHPRTAVGNSTFEQRRPSAWMVPNGCLNTGAISTTYSNSSASKILLTTNDLACGMWSILLTRVGLDRGAELGTPNSINQWPRLEDGARSERSESCDIPHSFRRRRR